MPVEFRIGRRAERFDLADDVAVIETAKDLLYGESVDQSLDLLRGGVRNSLESARVWKGSPESVSGTVCVVCGIACYDLGNGWIFGF